MPGTGSRLKTADLTDRVVVVTGAGSGIGREVALLCARRHARLALCDISEAALDGTAQMAERLGVEVLTCHVDVSDADSMSSFADATFEHFGQVDLLVNNAGVGLVGGFLDTNVKDWQWLINVNLRGVVHGCGSFLPRMIASGRGGHVVNLSSAAGLLANPQLTAYSATKFAVLGLSERCAWNSSLIASVSPQCVPASSTPPSRRTASSAAPRMLTSGESTWHRPIKNAGTPPSASQRTSFAPSPAIAQWRPSPRKPT